MTKFLALAAAVSAVAPAFAQLEDTYPSGVGIRAGYAYPLDDGVRDRWRHLIGVGVDYTLPRSLLPGGETYVTVDWLGGSGSGANGNLFPVMLNQRFRPQGRDGLPGKTYGFIGAGVVFIDFNGSGSTIAGRGGIGVDLGENIFSEVAVVLSDAVRRTRANSVGIYVGYRF